MLGRFFGIFLYHEALSQAVLGNRAQVRIRWNAIVLRGGLPELALRAQKVAPDDPGLIVVGVVFQHFHYLAGCFALAVVLEEEYAVVPADVVVGWIQAQSLVEVGLGLLRVALISESVGKVYKRQGVVRINIDGVLKQTDAAAPVSRLFEREYHKDSDDQRRRRRKRGI